MSFHQSRLNRFRLHHLGQQKGRDRAAPPSLANVLGVSRYRLQRVLARFVSFFGIGVRLPRALPFVQANNACGHEYLGDHLTVLGRITPTSPRRPGCRGERPTLHLLPGSKPESAVRSAHPAGSTKRGGTIRSRLFYTCTSASTHPGKGQGQEEVSCYLPGRCTVGSNHRRWCFSPL